MSLPSHFPMKVADGKTVNLPSVGFGTWAAGETGWCKDATLAALKAGYRHLDCAWKYGVDEEVGAAIRESGIPRSEIFVTTKFWPHFAHPDTIELCLDKCLKNMGLDYVDLFLAHWPFASKATSRAGLEQARAGPDVPLVEQGQLKDPETGKDQVVDFEYSSKNLGEAVGVKGSYVPNWQAMQHLVSTGKTRAVGVSNFSIAQLEELLPHATDVPISCNQIEAHPWLPNTELINFMHKHDIVATCYCPFAGQQPSGKRLLDNETVQEIAKKNDMGLGQCLQSWAVGRGTVPLGKSQSEERIKQNLAVRKLPAEDVKKLDALKQEGDKGRGVDFGEKWGVALYR